MNRTLSRRSFLKLSGAATLALTGCQPASMFERDGGDAHTESGHDGHPNFPSDAIAHDDGAQPDTNTYDAATDGTQDASLDGNRDLPEDFASIPEIPGDFPLGIMAGDVTPTQVVLWTRYTGTGVLALRVVEMDRDRIVAVSFQDDVAVSPDGFVHVDVSGLRPRTHYQYAFLIRARDRYVARSPVGRFRTAFDDGALDVLTFAGTSCTRQTHRPFPVLAHAARRGDLDFFIHCGDHTYCDGARTLVECRAKYEENWTAPGMQALHASTALYTTLDDHEVDNNFDPETFDRTALTNAIQAFFEHRAIRRDPMVRNRIWRSFKWGRTAEVFVLDCRTERRPSTRTSPSAQYISREQMDWLKTGLMRSNAVFKFIVNSVPITNFPGLFDVQASDRWEGYAAQRNEILDFIVSHGIQGVWWLSGDFHLGSVGMLETSGPWSRMREVLMGPGGNNENPLWRTLGAPQFDFATGASNYTLFRADPIARTLEIAFIDARGETLFQRRYSA